MQEVTGSIPVSSTSLRLMGSGSANLKIHVFHHVIPAKAGIHSDSEFAVILDVSPPARR
jgi:hypothetical protein